ncbi:MAG TPA: hypothetical protein PLD47_13360 [Aggregatilineales bacterium]|nr:hypothetical protein [Anaerolineales bacterium]HRE48707.1 hypothetical protein [Aggregatilineales bacterium]
MSNPLRIAWGRFRNIGEAQGEYIAAFVTFLMYFTVIVPFALIARYAIDPLEMRKNTAPHWRSRKPVGAALEDARSQS